MSRRRRRSRANNVELNLAAMLDMAFQLLTFFILTFRPAPMEGQLALNLPPPRPAITENMAVNENQAQGDGPAFVRSLVINVPSTPNGDVRSCKVGLGMVFTGPANESNLYKLNQRLKTVTSMADAPFEQVLIQVGKELRYEELMKIIDVCTQQKMSDGTRVQNISFTEITDQGG